MVELMSRKPPAKMTKRDYEIGYGRPPKSTRWKPGQSGNPLGRKKGSKNNSSLWREVMEEKVEITEGGRLRRISVREAAMRVVRNKALKGDLKAITLMLAEGIEIDHEAKATAIPTSSKSGSTEEAMRTYFDLVKRRSDR